MPFDEITTFPLDLIDEDEEANETSIVLFPSEMNEDEENDNRPEVEQSNYVLLQKWDGYVLKADDEKFSVRLYDSAGLRKPHQALFARSELPETDQSLIEEGALLVWMIGLRQIGMRRRRESEIYVRRLPPWTETEIQAAKVRAGALHGRIDWE